MAKCINVKVLIICLALIFMENSVYRKSSQLSNLHTEFYNQMIAGGIDKLVNLIDRSISIVKLRILIEKVIRI